MKNKQLIIITFTLLLVLLIIILKVGVISSKNVFDEMYHTEIKTIKKQEKIGFVNMKDIHQWPRENVNYIGNMVSENYKDSVLKRNESIAFLFLFNDRKINITHSKIMDKNIYLRICYDYYLSKNKLKIYIIVDDENLDDFTISDEKTIKKYLQQYDILESELKRSAHDVLYNRVFPDWFEAYNSRFSIDNIGKIKIEKDSFLK